MTKKIEYKIDKHIKRVGREARKIQEQKYRAIQFADEVIANIIDVPLSGLMWNVKYFAQKRYSREHISTGISENILTYNHTDSGSGATWDINNSTWTDTGKSWSADEWEDHYLKINEQYYLITSNTATVLTVIALEHSIPDESQPYTIIPFIPDQFIGSYLVPDTSVSSRRLEIIENTETTITIETETLLTGEVTTGDSVSPYNTFNDSSKTIYEDDSWNNYTLKFTSGSNNGESQAINDFVQSTGQFVTDNFTNAIVIGDDFEINDNLLWVSSGSTFRIEGYITPSDDDFSDTSLVAIGDVLTKTVTTQYGEINEANLIDYINAIYSIEIRANKTTTFSLDIDCQDSIKILQTPRGGITTTLIDSGFKPNTAASVSISLSSGVWYRIDIYFYAEDGANGFRFSVNEKPFGYYISAWRNVLPTAPAGLSATAGDKQITLNWTHNDSYKTQIFYSTNGGTTWTYLTTVAENVGDYTHTGLVDNQQYDYKIRHISSRGDLSSYSSSVNATTWASPDNTTITFEVSGNNNYPYLKTNDSITIKVTSNGRPFDLAVTPKLEIYDGGGGSVADVPKTSSNEAYQCTFAYAGSFPSLSDDDDYYWRFTFALAGMNASMTTDSSTFTIDNTDPTLDSAKFMIDSDGITTASAEEIIVRASAFLISQNGAVSDSLSGTNKLYCQPCLFSTSTTSVPNRLIDTKLIDWNVGSLNGYYLIDSTDTKFTISSFDKVLGVFNLSGTPLSGAYKVVRYGNSDPTTWQYELGYTNDGIYSIELDKSMASDWLHNNEESVVKYGMLISASDKSGNVETSIASFAEASIRYNTDANLAPQLTSKFINDTTTGQEAFSNENEWFNDANLYLRIETEDSAYQWSKISYRTWDGSNWSSWIDSFSSPTDVTLSEGELMVQYYATARDGGGQSEPVMVHYKYDKTNPTWTIAGNAAEGGFNRIGLSWSNDASDTGSGVRCINIYRNTSNTFESAVLIGSTTFPTEKSYVDETATDSTQIYYYWGKAKDFAGNEQTTEQQIDDGTGVYSVLLLPADVDGALRIINNPSGANWNVIYGIQVPIQAVIITAGALVNVSTVTAVEYKEDDDDTWHSVSNLKYRDQTVSLPHSISGLGANETRTLIFDPVQSKKYWRVVFNHADAETEITMVHFESLLAADIIVGGVLRLEKGLSIWTGSFDASGTPTGSGMFIDKFGMEMWDASGDVNMQLKNDGSAVLGRVEGGKITIDIAGVITIDSGLLTINADTIFGPGYDPTDKTQHFMVEPTTPYWEGDWWSDGTDIKRCINTKLSGSFVAGDWGFASDYTNDTVANQALSDAATAQSTADGKIVSFWQDSEPTAEGVGDIWFDTDNGNKAYRWNGSAWVDAQDDDIAQALSDAATAQSTADGKIVTFYQDSEPTAEGVGDIWVDTDDGNKLYRWSGSAWQEATDATFDQNFIIYSATEPITRPDGSSLEEGDMWIETDEGNRPYVYNDAGEGSWEEAYTEINGNNIVTGKIESVDGKTYFDLDNSEIKLDHPTTDVYSLLRPTGLIRTYDNGVHIHPYPVAMSAATTSDVNGAIDYRIFEEGGIDLFGLGSVSAYRNLLILSAWELRIVAGDSYHEVKDGITMYSYIGVGTNFVDIKAPNGTFTASKWVEITFLSTDW